ncbi:MAG: response regulator transcription factor [Planctomycetota bacterium]
MESPKKQHWRHVQRTEPANASERRSRFNLIDNKQWAYIKRRYRLSPRELQVAALVCSGYTNDGIANELKVTSGTVKTHLRSIFGKTNARTKITMLLTFVAATQELHQGPSSPPGIPIVELGESKQRTSENKARPKAK